MRRKEIPEALLDEIVREAREGVTPWGVLAERAGMCRETFTRRLREMGVAPKHVDRIGRRYVPPRPKPPLPPRPDMVVAAALKVVPSARAPDDSATLALRLRRQIDEQLTAIEGLQGKIDENGYQRFLIISRMLSGLTRTLQAAMRAEQTQPPPRPQQDYDFARDFDEVRRELAERLEAILAEPEEAFSGEPD
jgi:hypothetical protein